MKTETADDLAKVSIALMIGGIVFALAGETRSAIVLEAIAVAIGLVCTYASPIKPWH